MPITELLVQLGKHIPCIITQKKFVINCTKGEDLYELSISDNFHGGETTLQVELSGLHRVIEDLVERYES